MRQGNLELSRNAGVLPLLGKLGGVPQVRPIPRPIGVDAFRQDDLGMFNALLGGVVVRDPVALVGQLFRAAIGRRSDRASAGCPSTGNYRISVELLEKISDALKVSPTRLLKR